jgi:pilus assembly protein CpaB
MEIIATTASSGTDNNVQEEPENGEDAELASTITVLSTPEQARLLAELEQTGKLHAALVYRGGSENAQKFLDEQAKVLAELYPAKTLESEVPADESENTDHTQAPASDEGASTTSGSTAQE